MSGQKNMMLILEMRVTKKVDTNALTKVNLMIGLEDEIVPAPNRRKKLNVQSSKLPIKIVNNLIEQRQMTGQAQLLLGKK